MLVDPCIRYEHQRTTHQRLSEALISVVRHLTQEMGGFDKSTTIRRHRPLFSPVLVDHDEML